MRKQGKKRNVNYGLKPKAPILVMRSIEGVKLQSREWKAVNDFAYGNATDETFLTLQDMLNLLLIAGQSSPDRRYALVKVEEEFKPAVASIQSRYEKTGKWGVTAPELDALRKMIAFNHDFWIRQPTELLQVCVAEAKAFYQEQEDRRKAA